MNAAEEASPSPSPSILDLGGWAAWGVMLGIVLALVISATGWAAARGKPAAHPSAAAPAAPAEMAESDSVWIMRPDGSKSCEGEPPEKSGEAWRRKLEAKGITVLKLAKGDDGMAHIMMCGAPTGRLDLFLIPSGRWADVEAMGFLKATPEIVASATASK